MTQAFQREKVPENKEFRMSTRENSEYKWKTGKVVGAFEVSSHPTLDLLEPLKPMLASAQYAEKWLEAQELWKSMHLRKSFVEAAKSVPAKTCCCGMITDDKETMNDMVPFLNNTWAKEANKKLEDKGLYVDTYLWRWSNISGEANTIIMLIRFHEIQNDPEKLNNAVGYLGDSR